MTTQPPLHAELPVLSGITEAEARRRLREEGPNELPRSESRHLLHTALEVLREPMSLLLLAAGAVYLVLGESVDSDLEDVRGSEGDLDHDV
jgi:P-type Ca2+ transporter type 2C